MLQIKILIFEKRLDILRKANSKFYQDSVCMYAKQKHLGCKKSARPKEAAFVNESATKSSDIR